MTHTGHDGECESSYAWLHNSMVILGQPGMDEQCNRVGVQENKTESAFHSVQHANVSLFCICGTQQVQRVTGLPDSRG